MPPHWYTPERFAHRVLLEIRRDPRSRSRSSWAASTGSRAARKRSEVAAAAGLSYAPLAALLDGSGTALDPAAHRQRCSPRCRTASRAPKPAVLGAVGKEDVRDLGRATTLIRIRRPPSFLLTPPSMVWLATTIPFRWEIGFAHLPGPTERQLLVGQNFSPAIVPDEMPEDVLRTVALARRQRRADRPVPPPDHARPADARLRQDRARLRLERGVAVRDALEKIAKPWIKRRAPSRGKKPPTAAGRARSRSA